MLEIERFHLFIVVLIGRLHTITYLQLSAVGGVTDGEIRVSGAPPTANQTGGWVGSRTVLGRREKSLTLTVIRTAHHLDQCFSTAGPRPDTEPWHKLFWATKGLRKLYNMLQDFISPVDN